MRDAILLDLFESNLPLQDILARHQVQIDQVLDWFESADIQRRIQRITRLINTRTKMLFATLRSRALTTLERAAAGDEDITETRRKAAAQLLRTRDAHLTLTIEPPAAPHHPDTTDHPDDRHDDTRPDDLPTLRVTEAPVITSTPEQRHLARLIDDLNRQHHPDAPPADPGQPVSELRESYRRTANAIRRRNSTRFKRRA